MSDTLTIFHKSDLDGLCSEAIARKVLGDRSDYLGFEYGDKIPDLTPYTTIYLLDISLPVEVMRANASKLVWIDHHKSAIEAMAGAEIAGYRIDGVAACRLAWQWFAATGHQRYEADLPAKADYVDLKVDEPYAVQLLGMYDIWDKRWPEVDLFQLGMQAEQSPDWNLLLTVVENNPSSYVAKIVERGRAIQSYTDTTNAQTSKERGFDVMFEGLLFRALCMARCNSLTFTAALRPEHDGCLGYFWNGTTWKFSLYGVPGKEHIDLSVIAKKYGGGGHRQAAGGFFKNLPVEFGGFALRDLDFAGRV